MQQPTLSIVLPCYNPIEGWAEKVTDSVNNIAASTSLRELIIVNDGSSVDLEHSMYFIRQYCKVSPVFISYEGNRGKGYAIRMGLDKASSDIIIYTDIDFPYTHDSFMKVYHALEAGESDIAVGVKDAGYYKSVPITRMYVSKVLRKMISLVLSLSITDTQCGLKGMQQRVKAIWLQGTIDRYLFDLEAIYTASQRKLRLKAIPVQLREGVVFSKVSNKILLNELKNFWSIVRRRF